MMSWPFVGSQKLLKSTATHDLFFQFFFLSPFAQFFLPLFLSVVHNWGSLYGLIKQPPPIGSLCFWSHFMRNACPCLNVLIVLIDVPVLCPPGLLKSKKFQNMEKGLGVRHCADNPTSKHIWLQTYCNVRDQSNAAWRISPILLPFTVAERNVIWQTNVVTDSLSGGFYGPSVLLVRGYSSLLNSQRCVERCIYFCCAHFFKLFFCSM